MRLLLLALLVACGGKAAEKPKFTASCKPDSTMDNMECTVENVGKVKGRACVTSREQPPKEQPLVARRVCTAVLEPGAKVTFKPKFDRYESLQKICAPAGTWVCKDEIVESPDAMTDNIPTE